MIERVVDARIHAAGLVESALAAPLGQDDALRAVGPFAIIAHALPHSVEPGALPPDFDVRPHPHIGLAAITYLLQGHITHRDSLGSRQEIGPGGLNYMIAGRGVVHSERFERVRLLGGTVELLQILLALPDGHEDAEPSFASMDSARVPRITESGATIVWLAGGAPQVDAPVRFPAPLFLCDVELTPGARYRPPEGLVDRAVYVLRGAIDVDGTRVSPQQVAVLAPGAALITASEPARILAFGGEPVGPRHMWWNYIHSSLERIEVARAEWRAGKVPLPPGDTESFAAAPPDHGRPLLRLNMGR
jgi:redox-sensitive bicupin YhaK (pirin superfamily)